MKWVHMQATELRIELHLLVFHFQKDADSLDADFGPETQVLNKKNGGSGGPNPPEKLKRELNPEI